MKPQNKTPPLSATKQPKLRSLLTPRPSKRLLFARLAQHDARNPLDFLVIYDHFGVHGVEQLRLFKIIDTLSIHPQFLVAEGAAKVGMRVFGVILYHTTKIPHSSLMLPHHLVGLGPLMQIINIHWFEFDGAAQGEDCFFELVEAAVGETNMIINVSLLRKPRPLLLLPLPLLRLVNQGLLQRLDGLLVLAVGVVGEAQLVEERRVIRAHLQPLLQILYSLTEKLHRLCLTARLLRLIVVALAPVKQEVNVLGVGLNGEVVVALCLLIVTHGVVAPSQSILNARIPFLFILGRRMIPYHIVFFILGQLKIINCFLVLAQVILAETGEIVSFSEFPIQLDRIREVLESRQVIAHGLIYLSSRNENGFVVIYAQKDLGEVVEGFLILLGLVINESEMKLALDVILVQFECLLKELNSSLIILLRRQLARPYRLHLIPLRLRLVLVRYSLLVPVPGVARLEQQRLVIVEVRQLVHGLGVAPVKVEVAAIEIPLGILWVALNRHIKVLFGIDVVPVLLESETEVDVVV